jgi:hypothetical protein
MSTAGEKVLLGNIKGPKGDPGDISLAVPLTQKGAANGVATLDGSSHVPAVQLANAILATALGVPNGAASLDGSGRVPSAQLALAVLTSQLGVANGAASLDSGGQVPASELGNVPPAVLPGDFYPEDYGAVGGAKIATDVSINATQTFTSSQMAANASIGQWVMIDGGNDTQPGIGQITAISGTSITITSRVPIGNTNTNLVAIYGTDDSAALNNALDAARSWAEAHQYDARVWLQHGPYVVATNTQSNDGTALYNAAVKWPHPSNNNVRKLAVSLVGLTRADSTRYWSSGVPTALRSAIVAMTTAPSNLDGTYGPQSVIGSAVPQSGMAGTISPTFVNTKPILINVQVITPTFTNLTAFDFRYSCSLYMDGCGATAFANTAVGNGVHLLTAYPNFGSQDTQGTGARFPVGGNNADVFVPSFHAVGYNVGLWTPSEHVRIGHYVALYTGIALKVGSGGTTGHGLSIGHVTAEGYQGGIAYEGGGSGNIPIFIDSWSTETSGDAYDINDPGNAFVGYVRWYNFTDSRDIEITGASRLRIIDENYPRGGAVSPGVFGLTDAATILVNARKGNVFRVTLGGNRTMGVPSNPQDGQTITFELTQDGTGSRTVTWTSGSGGYSFGVGSAPALSATAGALDIVAFRYNSVKNRWLFLGASLGY